MENASAKVRIDRWLWATRVFKTRGLASEACRLGRVLVDGEPTKASRLVRAGQRVQAQKGDLRLVLKIKDVIEKRVGAKLVPDYLEDLTPPEEFERVRLTAAQKVLTRERGAGRPTKKERRDLERLMGEQ